LSTKLDKALIAVVHNVRSLHNVGSIFRTADSAGISKLYLTGYTPSPVDEMGRLRVEVSKTALGAESIVPWEHKKNISPLLASLKKDGVKLIALENSKGATDYKKFKLMGTGALILGNEVRGLTPSLIKKVDEVISIPMKGSKESLNVAVAFGIAAYQLLSSDT
jgi:tRNA G18 (ribose-2'-O)-methylase SpoU